MNDKDIVVELAKMDGFEVVRPVGWTENGYVDKKSSEYIYNIRQLPNYLQHHESIISLIKKQGDEILIPLMKWLYRENDDIGIMKHVFLATPRKLCVALLKVKGKWKSDDADAPNYEADSTWQEKFKKTFEKPVTRKPRK